MEFDDKAQNEDTAYWLPIDDDIEINYGKMLHEPSKDAC